MVLTHNRSGRFESRFVSVGIQESPSIWLRGMEGSALGVWVAHGEGKVRAVCTAGNAALKLCSHQHVIGVRNRTKCFSIWFSR